MVNNDEILQSIDFSKVTLQDFTFKVNRRADAKLLYNISDILPIYTEEHGLHLELENERGTDSSILKLERKVVEMLAPKHILKELPYEDVAAEFADKKKLIVKELVERSFAIIERPTPVQSIAIPEMIRGHDAIIQSNSGTGKTIAQVIGCLWHFNPRDTSLQHIFITSSHEVATQIYKNVQMLAPGDADVQLCIGHKRETRPRGGFITGKTNQHETRVQFMRRISGAQILVCTMGKFYDCMFNMKIINTDHLKTICVDEFDNILSPSASRSDNVQSTANQIKNVFSAIPPSTQRAFFSATIADALGCALKYFRQGYGVPLIALKESDDIFLEGIRQYYVDIRDIHDETVNKIYTVLDILQNVRLTQCIIFANHVETVERIKDCIQKEISITTAAFHAGLSANERTRITSAFMNGDYKILVSTDVLARGYDVQHVNLVINFDMPSRFETYLHRIGRAGRFGRKGVAISLISSGALEMDKVDEINALSPKSQMMELPLAIDRILE